MRLYRIKLWCSFQQIICLLFQLVLFRCTRIYHFSFFTGLGNARILMQILVKLLPEGNLLSSQLAYLCYFLYHTKQVIFVFIHPCAFCV